MGKLRARLIWWLLKRDLTSIGCVGRIYHHSIVEIRFKVEVLPAVVEYVDEM